MPTESRMPQDAFWIPVGLPFSRAIANGGGSEA
jgi:hypothetical protein